MTDELFICIFKKGKKVNKIDLRFTGRHLAGSKKIHGEYLEYHVFQRLPGLWNL